MFLFVDWPFLAEQDIGFWMAGSRVYKARCYGSLYKPLIMDQGS